MRETTNMHVGESNVVELRRRLEEAEEIVTAIRSYKVDGFVIEDSKGERVYTLQLADGPYRRFVECMGEGALTLSLDGTILFSNARFAEMIKHPPERLNERSLNDFVPAEHRPALRAFLLAASSGAQRGDWTLCNAEGVQVPVSLTVSPMNIESVQALCVIVADLTADRLKDAFLATVSHELRTPLTAIAGWAHVMRREGLDDTVMTRAIDAIERAAALQAKLIDDMLDVSRIVAGTLRLDLQPVELIPIIDAAIDTMRPIAEAKGIEIETNLDPLGGTTAGDASRLQQILGNLLSNAVKFTPKGGRVYVQLTRVNDNLEIIVRDTGEGIDPQFLPHVLEPFRQADRSEQRRHGGLGLGLAIVRQLVELHGGVVHVASQGLGCGATLTVKLPVLQAT